MQKKATHITGRNSSRSFKLYQMSYRDDLIWSNSPAIRNQLDAWYRIKFPNLDRIVIMTELNDQFRGRDILLLMKDGTYCFVDEKMRKEKYKQYVQEACLIEFEKASGQLGWVNKELEIKWIIYGCENGPIYRIPWPALKLAWLKYGDQWRKEYGEISDAEKTSLNCPVPWAILGNAIKEFQ